MSQRDIAGFGGGIGGGTGSEMKKRAGEQLAEITTHTLGRLGSRPTRATQPTEPTKPTKPLSPTKGRAFRGGRRVAR